MFWRKKKIKADFFERESVPFKVEYQYFYCIEYFNKKYHVRQGLKENGVLNWLHPVLLIDGSIPRDFHDVPIQSYAIFDNESDAKDFIDSCIDSKKLKNLSYYVEF